MVDTLKQLLVHQFEAAFCMLGICIHRCPEDSWNAPVGNLAFCQVVFHALFFTDFYLGENELAFRQQAFHRDHADFFRDYEELEDRKQQLLYDRQSIKEYLQYCREKAIHAVSAETQDSLQGSCGFPRRGFSRAELYVYNLRHIQHHAAQLSLRLRIDAQQDIPWVGSGWSSALVGEVH